MQVQSMHNVIRRVFEATCFIGLNERSLFAEAMMQSNAVDGICTR